MTTRALAVIGGGLLMLGVLGLTAGTLFAQTPPQTPTPSAPATTFTREQMQQMMDAMHGEGTSQRMGEAAPGFEQMVDQCVAMMNMMGNMMGMMQGTQGMQGMMGTDMSGTMGRQPGQSMQDAMQRMMGR